MIDKSAIQAPPPAPSMVACGDELQPKTAWPKGWKPKRPPRCNRPAGHAGPHQEIRRSDFALRAEWER
jgi:hypothetical protein